MRVGPHNLADILGSNHNVVFHRTKGPLDTNLRPIVIHGDGSKSETKPSIPSFFSCQRVEIPSPASDPSLTLEATTRSHDSSNQESNAVFLFTPEATQKSASSTASSILIHMKGIER